MGANHYQCEHCGNILKTYNTKKTFTCKNCLKKSTAIVIEQSTNNNLSEPAINLDFNVETTNTEINPITESTQPVSSGISKKPNTPTFNSSANSTYLKKPFTADTLKKMFEGLDALMVKKSNNQIWDITKTEEEKLAEATADVLNEYFPEATSKTTKLGIMTALYLSVYTPRIIGYLDAYKKKQKEKVNNNGNDKPDTSTYNGDSNNSTFMGNMDNTPTN